MLGKGAFGVVHLVSARDGGGDDDGDADDGGAPRRTQRRLRLPGAPAIGSPATAPRRFALKVQRDDLPPSDDHEAAAGVGEREAAEATGLAREHALLTAAAGSPYVVRSHGACELLTLEHPRESVISLLLLEVR